jgi:hypothetical protein
MWDVPASLTICCDWLTDEHNNSLWAFICYILWQLNLLPKLEFYNKLSGVSTALLLTVNVTSLLRNIYPNSPKIAERTLCIHPSPTADK